MYERALRRTSVERCVHRRAKSFTTVGFAFNHSAAAISGGSCRSKMAAIISLSPRRVNLRFSSKRPMFGHSAPYPLRVTV